jgi:putative CocE/NonD family hydrolase
MKNRFFWISVLCVLCVSQFCGPSAVQSEGEIALTSDWIPMPDGIRLAVDLYRPTAAKKNERFPVLLEYLPYRKDESRGRCYSLFSYFVERGYIVARVDIRGTGNSEGHLIEYEYTDQEQEDGEAVIEWLAKQPFSTGNVGMFGVSWGGFNSIHMAMRNPPALKAIIAVDATDDLYQDDVHFIDGVFHFDSWEVSQEVENSLPGAPEFAVDESFFANRFDTTPWMLVYKRQQRDGPFWDRASLNVDYSKIRIPTYVIGGWYDGYRDSVPRMLQHMTAPVKGLIGPWGHSFPNWGYPEPKMEWRYEAVRWFDHWLKGKETGIMEEPKFAVYVRDWHPPGLTLDRAPGQWRWEESWPLERGRLLELNLHPDHRLVQSQPEAARHDLKYIPSVGIEAGGSVMWWGDFMPDQRPTDEHSLIYDTEPLDEDTEILGFPRVVLNASSSAPLADWFVRLSDVAPDGRVTQITGAGFNGAHRNSAVDPEPLVPDETYALAIEMHFTSWVFPKGHRIRLSVSNAQWPMFWPTPYPMTTNLKLGGEAPSRILLPVVPYEPRPQPRFHPPAADPVLAGYGPAESATVSGYAELSDVVRDAEAGTATVTLTNSTTSTYPWGSIKNTENLVHHTNDLDPAQTSFRGSYGITIELSERVLNVSGTIDFRSDAENFYFLYTKRIQLNSVLLRERTWQETIKRDFQ